MSTSVTGYSKNEPLADRMKRYESVTDFTLVPGIPIYVRLDQRAGHTFTEKLEKPFDRAYMRAIVHAAKKMVADTNPLIAYCQSDEISLVYECPEKTPFEGRLFKLQSVFASMVASAFAVHGMDYGTMELATAIRKNPPSFDCRVCQMSLDECANMILWRQRDCIKNSITLAALDEFSTKEIEGKNSADKIEMLREGGIEFSEKYSEEERLGTFIRKSEVERKLSEEELRAIPENHRPVPDLFGDVWARRSVVGEIRFGRPLEEMLNRKDVLFGGKEPVFKPC